MRRGTVGLGGAPFRQEELMTHLAEQFLERVTGHFCGHPVRIKNPAVGVDDDDRLGKAFENRAVEGFGFCAENFQQATVGLRVWQHDRLLLRNNWSGATGYRCFDNDWKVTTIMRCGSVEPIGVSRRILFCSGSMPLAPVSTGAQSLARHSRKPDVVWHNQSANECKQADAKTGSESHE